MKICVYGATSDEIDASFIKATEELGALMAKRGHTLVYGGGASGLMGAAARGAKSQNGEIIGIAPSFFEVDGVLFDGCTEFIYTETMRERKALMEEKSDAFIMTPGGVGTFDEFFEILSLRQVARHDKPIAVFNVNGYYDALRNLMQNALDKKFMTEATFRLAKFYTTPEEIIEYFENYTPSEYDFEVLKKVKKD